MKYRPTKSRRWADQRRNRRIIQEYGLQEAKRVGALDSTKEQKKKEKDIKKQLKIQKKQQIQSAKSKTGHMVGENYAKELSKFIEDGGDPNSCPFD
jgi:hypothetical protein